MEWNEGREGNSNKGGKDPTLTILLVMIIFLIIIIFLLYILLMSTAKTSYSITMDNKILEIKKDTLIAEINDTTYVNIEEFAKLVKYEYHDGEYKSFVTEKDKCYVQGVEETATFFVNENKVCKLPVDMIQEEYRKYTVKNTIIEEKGKIYAPVEAISKAFNVSITQTEGSFNIYTLDQLVKTYNQKAIKLGYEDITTESFENQKAILYGFLIVKTDRGLYKVIDCEAGKEIVPDKYSNIQFTENTQEFSVTNTMGQVGIINLDGTIKIEPIYESIETLEKENDLYIVQKDTKFGIVKSGNVTILNTEYDKVGLPTTENKTIDIHYFLLDTLIPVCKNDKWGAINRKGEIILNVEYDQLGYDLGTVQVNQLERKVEPVLTIDRCKGIVVKQGEKYGLIGINGENIVPIQVDAIYARINEKVIKEKYYMLYNGEELNLIKKLLEAGIISEETKVVEDDTNVTQNTTTVTSNVTVSSPGISNSVATNSVQ